MRSVDCLDSPVGDRHQGEVHATVAAEESEYFGLPFCAAQLPAAQPQNKEFQRSPVQIYEGEVGPAPKQVSKAKPPSQKALGDVYLASQ